MARTVFALLCAAAFMGGCSEKTEQELNDSFDNGFRESCIGSATASGAPKEAATAVCNCVIEQVDAKYSVTEKIQLSEAEMMPIMEQCVKGMVQK